MCGTLRVHDQTPGRCVIVVFTFVDLLYVCVYMCVRDCICVCCVWRSEDSVQELVLFIHRGVLTWAVRRGSQHLYVKSHLAGLIVGGGDNADL